MEDDVRQSGQDRYAVSQAYRWKAERDKAMQELAKLKDRSLDTTVSAYDLLSKEDREALRWVRGHGGLDEVRRDFQDAYNRRSELCAALGIDLDTGWSDAMDELDRRLMPEGMEWLLDVWPKWSNGEYCKFGDWWKSDKYGEFEPQQFSKLAIYTPEQLREWGQDDGDNYGYEWDFMRPSDPKYRPDKSEPPAPKVLAADGEPLLDGDEVWRVKDGDGPYHVQEIRDGVSVCVEETSCEFMPKELTHERPESWERIEADAMMDAKVYCESRGISPEYPKHNGKAKCEDIVRRCKALAERERSE